MAIDCALFITFDISHIALGHGYLWLKNMVHFVTGKLLTIHRVTIDQAQVEIKMFCEIVNGSTEDFILDVLFARAAGGIKPAWPNHWTTIVLCFPHLHSNNKHFWSRQHHIIRTIRDFLQSVNKTIIDFLESIETWEAFVIFRAWLHTITSILHLPIPLPGLDVQTLNEMHFKCTGTL